MSEDGKKGAQKHKENGTGIFSLSKEQLQESARKAALKTMENKTGIFSLSKEQTIENAKKVSTQVWECTITGYRSTPGGLALYQKARGIDKSNRIRIQ